MKKPVNLQPSFDQLTSVIGKFSTFNLARERPIGIDTKIAWYKTRRYARHLLQKIGRKLELSCRITGAMSLVGLEPSLQAYIA